MPSPTTQRPAPRWPSSNPPPSEARPPFKITSRVRISCSNKVSLSIRFISLRSENGGSFRFFRLFFASFHFRFASDFYVPHRCETSEKSTFFRTKAKKISLPFRFEAKMMAHPTKIFSETSATKCFT
jgi:hypothetical protein